MEIGGVPAALASARYVRHINPNVVLLPAAGSMSSPLTRTDGEPRKVQVRPLQTQGLLHQVVCGTDVRASGKRQNLNAHARSFMHRAAYQRAALERWDRGVALQ